MTAPSPLLGHYDVNVVRQVLTERRRRQRRAILGGLRDQVTARSHG